MLASLAVGIAAYRLTGPLARALERATHGASTTRLALVAVARRPEPAAATVAFLAVAVGLAVFAGSYRATLERGQRDQAAFAVPLDATVTTGRSLVTPLDAAPLASYAAIAPDATVLPVLRRNATVPSVGAQPLRVEVLAVPACGPARAAWRDDYAPTSADRPGRGAGAGAVRVAWPRRRCPRA